MERIEKSIEVGCPVRTVYNQWTQFEEFPRFMEGVKEVTQLDDTHVHWHAEVWGKDKEWDAEITEQVPDERISWRSVSGAHNAGTVRFEPLGPDRTRVRLVMAYEPEGAIENVGDALGVMSGRVEHTVKDFKKFIESRGQETGAWRGEVHDSQAQPNRPGTSRSTSVTGAMDNPSGSAGGSATGGSRGTSGTSGASGTNVGGSSSRPARSTGRGRVAGDPKSVSDNPGHAPGHGTGDVPNDAWPFVKK